MIGDSKLHKNKNIYLDNIYINFTNMQNWKYRHLSIIINDLSWISFICTERHSVCWEFGEREGDKERCLFELPQNLGQGPQGGRKIQSCWHKCVNVQRLAREMSLTRSGDRRRYERGKMLNLLSYVFEASLALSIISSQKCISSLLTSWGQRLRVAIGIERL